MWSSHKKQKKGAALGVISVPLTGGNLWYISEKKVEKNGFRGYII